MTKTPTQIKSLARAHTERAIQVLQGIMDEPDSGAPARVAAANSLLDRGWGKPAQAQAGPDGEGAVKVEYSWKSDTSRSTIAPESNSSPSTIEPSGSPVSSPTDEPEKP